MVILEKVGLLFREFFMEGYQWQPYKDTRIPCAERGSWVATAGFLLPSPPRLIAEGEISVTLCSFWEKIPYRNKFSCFSSWIFYTVMSLQSYLCFILTSMFIALWKSNVLSDTVVPVGHLKPLGSHRPPQTNLVDDLEEMPSPQDFWRKYVLPSRAVVLRGAAKHEKLSRNGQINTSKKSMPTWRFDWREKRKRVLKFLSGLKELEETQLVR